MRCVTFEMTGLKKYLCSLVGTKFEQKNYFHKKNIDNVVAYYIVVLENPHNIVTYNGDTLPTGNYMFKLNN